MATPSFFSSVFTGGAGFSSDLFPTAEITLAAVCRAFSGTPSPGPPCCITSRDGSSLSISCHISFWASSVDVSARQELHFWRMDGSLFARPATILSISPSASLFFSRMLAIMEGSASVTFLSSSTRYSPARKKLSFSLRDSC